MSVPRLTRVYPQLWRNMCGWISRCSRPAAAAICRTITHAVTRESGLRRSLIKSVSQPAGGFSFARSTSQAAMAPVSPLNNGCGPPSEPGHSKQASAVPIGDQSKGPQSAAGTPAPPDLLDPVVLRSNAAQSCRFYVVRATRTATVATTGDASPAGAQRDDRGLPGVGWRVKHSSCSRKEELHSPTFA